LIDAYQKEVITLDDLNVRKGSVEQKISQIQEQIKNLKAAEKSEMDHRKIFDNIATFCNAIKRGINNASFEDRRKIIELLVEEVIVTNGEVEIIHILPFDKKGELQLNGIIRAICVLSYDFSLNR